MYSRNASENPAGIETMMPCHYYQCTYCGRNASENPAGIETISPVPLICGIHIVATHQKTQQGLKLAVVPTNTNSLNSRNASENPAGIETGRQPDTCGGHRCRNASENPAGIETHTGEAIPGGKEASRNASENPAGIETAKDNPIEGGDDMSQRIRKPSRD